MHRHVKHRGEWEPEGVHGQLEGCNKNLQPHADLAKVYTHGKATAMATEILNLCTAKKGACLMGLLFRNMLKKNSEKRLLISIPGVAV